MRRPCEDLTSANRQGTTLCVREAVRPECPMPQETSSKILTLSRCSVSALAPGARSALPQRFPFGSSRAGQGLNLQQITGTKVPKEAQVIRSFRVHRSTIVEIQSILEGGGC